jgi:Protein of unknown function (DUF616)
MPSRCIYTTMIGSYEQLNEQVTARESSLPYICLTDDPNLRSDSWQIRQVAPTFAMDPIRSQRDLKIRPHVHLPEFDQSLYIDNSVVLKVEPEKIFDQFADEIKFAVPTHSYRENVLDEFVEVVKSAFDDPARIFEQLNHYALQQPELLDEKPFWSAILLRDHRDANVQKMLEIWMAHVFRYSRRDQLSINMAFRHAKLTPARIDVDNFQSWFHEWPQTLGRERSKGAREPTNSLSPAIFRLRKTEQALADRKRETDERLAEESRQLEDITAELTASRLCVQGLQRELEAARTSLADGRRLTEETQGELDMTRQALAASEARVAQNWQRYVNPRKRSFLRLPRWLAGQT